MEIENERSSVCGNRETWDADQNRDGDGIGQKGVRLNFGNRMGVYGKGRKDGYHTVQCSSDPVEYGTPKVDPTDELEVIRCIRLLFDQVKYRFVQHRNWAFHPNPRRCHDEKGT